MNGYLTVLFSFTIKSIKHYFIGLYNQLSLFKDDSGKSLWLCISIQWLKNIKYSFTYHFLSIFLLHIYYYRWNYIKWLVARPLLLLMQILLLIEWSYLLLMRSKPSHDSGISCIKCEKWRRRLVKSLMSMRWVICVELLYMHSIYLCTYSKWYIHSFANDFEKAIDHTSLNQA